MSQNLELYKLTTQSKITAPQQEQLAPTPKAQD